MKRKIEDAWRRFFLWKDGAFEVETVTILPEVVLRASGHVGEFGDPLVGCMGCKKKFRADSLISDAIGTKMKAEKNPDVAEKFKEQIIKIAAMKSPDLTKVIREHNIKCPDCKGELGDVAVFNLMFKTNIGPVEGNTGYARPETAQGIFLAFPRVFRAQGSKLPLGIGQIGKSFRNEISPRQGLLRLREFTQMELEYFLNPSDAKHPNFKQVENQKIRVLTEETQAEGKEDITEMTAKEMVEKNIAVNDILAYFLAKQTQFFQALGIPYEQLRFRQVPKDERAHYSKGTFDLEASTTYGWVEIVGTAYRTDFDMSNHAKMSKQDLSVFIEEEKKKVLPHVVEPSFGVDRIFWTLIEKCYRENGGAEGRDWSWFDFPPTIAPFTCAVLPLMKKDGLKEKAEEIAAQLREAGFNVVFDAAGSIGKRYARQDEIGTPYCVTIDYDTLEKGTATIRFRNDGKQITLDSKQICGKIAEFVNNGKVSA